MTEPSTLKRLFFALWPDGQQRERLRESLAPVAESVAGRPVDRGNWHVTLRFLGGTPASLVPLLLERTSEIEVEPFGLSFDRIEHWLRPRVACLVPSAVPDELLRLVARLNAVLVDAGLEPEERAYQPHLTLARKAPPFDTRDLAQPLTLEWTGFELLESISDRGGVRYLPLKQ